MSEVLGADQAVTGWSPLIPSVLRAAKQKNVRLHASAVTALRTAWDEVRAVRTMRAFKDVDASTEMLKHAWPHQRVDVQLMKDMRRVAYLLAHQPGVGKTLEAIAMALHWTRRTPDARILVIVPNSAKYQWKRELLRWTKQGQLTRPRIAVLDGTVVQQKALARSTSGWVIAHWQALAHAQEGLTALPWDVVIADEAHNAQNRNTVRARALYQLVSQYRLAITAHPYTNQPDELWSILHWLYQKEYSSFWRFFNQHVLAVPKSFGGFEVLGTRDKKLLKWELTPFMLRRTNASLGRTNVVRITRTVSLKPKSVAEYQRLRTQLFVELEAVANETPNVLLVPNVLARTTRLRQYLVDPALIKSSSASEKYPVVEELLQELDRPPVIFTAFRQAAERLQQYLKARRYTTALITGHVPSKQREQNKKSFLRGKLDALIVQTASGGESLNLGKYGYVIHLDLPWNPRGLEQSEGRVNRPEEGTGVLVPTTVFCIVVEQSYEQRQIARLERKHSTFTEVFTAESLRTLFEE